MDKQIVDLVVGHKWVALAAILIGLLVRLLKDDTSTIPVVVPAKWRPWLALGLGLVAGALDRVATGTPWGEALIAGAIAGLLPVVGHQYLIESLRGGQELGGVKPEAPPPQSSGGNGNSPRVPPMPLLMLCLAFLLALTGCPKEPQTPREMARGYLAVMGMAAQSGVHACAQSAEAMKAAGNPDWKPLATECADAYDVAKAALFGVEAALDTWEEADARRLACAAGTALQGIERISRAMSTRSIPLDKATKAQVEDGVRMAGWLLKTYGGTCVVVADAGGH